MYSSALPDPALAPAPSASPDVAAPDEAVRCPTCGAAVDTRFCGRCGERMLGPRDHSLAAFLGEAFSTLTTLDNRFWRTLRGIPRPGFLTEEYIAGRRGPYLGPLQLFLVFSVVFFVVSPRLGLSTARLDSFAESRVVGSVAAPLIAREVARRDIPREAFAAHFARVKQTQQRFMVVLAIPFFAGVLKLLYRRRSFVGHLAFATHALGSIMVLTVAYIFVLAFGVPLVRSAMGLPPAWGLAGVQLAVVFAPPIVAFVAAALRRVYGGTIRAAAARALLATAGLWLSMVLYEYALFVTTLIALRLGA